MIKIKDLTEDVPIVNLLSSAGSTDDPLVAVLGLHLRQHVESHVELEVLCLCGPLAVPPVAPPAAPGAEGPGEEDASHHSAQLGEDGEACEGGDLGGREGESAHRQGHRGGLLVHLQQQDEGDGEDGQREDGEFHLERKNVNNKSSGLSPVPTLSWSVRSAGPGVGRLVFIPGLSPLDDWEHNMEWCSDFH